MKIHYLKEDKELVMARDAVNATATPILQGITRASLQTSHLFLLRSKKLLKKY